MRALLPFLALLAGTLLAASFLYSLRKRKLIGFGSPRVLLRSHEALGWIGALVLLVHGGIRFNALIPWLALTAMVVVVASGLTGKLLLEGTRASLRAREEELRQAGLAAAEIEKELLGHSLDRMESRHREEGSARTTTIDPPGRSPEK